MKHTRKLTRKILPTLPSGAEVKIMWICTSTPPYILMVWCLVKHRETLPLPFYLYVIETEPLTQWAGALHCIR